MEMGKLTAKLRDAVPVCFLVEGKEIKRYRNVEIPDEIKKLEYQDFKFDVPLNGTITFKIMFEPGVLPETFPQTRERRTRALKQVLTDVLNESADTTPAEEAIEAIEATQDTIVSLLKAQTTGETTSTAKAESKTKNTKPTSNVAVKPAKIQTK